MESRKILFLFLLFLSFPFSGKAYYDLGKPAGYINDYAHVLTASQKESLNGKISVFEKETGNEIAVVFIQSLKDDTIENFAVKLFEQWGIGKKDKDNGVLILIAIDDRKMRIEVGYGLEGALTDAQASWIINDVMKPAFKESSYYQGVDGAVDKIISATKGEYVPSASDSPIKVIKKIFFSFIVLLGFFIKAITTESLWIAGLFGFIFGALLSWVLGKLSVTGFLVDYAIITMIGCALFSVILNMWLSKTDSGKKIRKRFSVWPRGVSGSDGGGFGGFGGGGSGGGGSSGSW